MDERKGLVGAVGGAKRSVVNIFSKPEVWLVRSTILASVISVFYYAGDKAKDSPTMAIMVLLGLAAVGFHYWGAKNACRSWYERQIGAFMLWIAIVAGAITWEVNNQLVVASANQDNLTNIRQTSFNAASDARGSVKEKETVLALALASRSKMEPRQSAAAARAVIDNSKAHKYWKATDNCTATKGQKTRDFCSAYLAAVADLSLWDNISAADKRVADAKADLDSARAAASGVKAVSSIERSDFKNLKRLANWYAGSEVSQDDLELSQSMLMILTMALFLTIAGWLIKSQEYEGQPRKPWGIANALHRAYRWLHRLLFGGEPGNVKIIENNTVVTKTDRAIGSALANVARNHGLVPA